MININDVILHYGVKGQKWGIIRWNKKRKNKSIEDRKSEILKKRSAKELYDNADLFSLEELRNAYDRLNAERDIKLLADKESYGRNFIETSVNTAKTASSFIESVSKIYSGYNKILNTRDELKKRKK